MRHTCPICGSWEHGHLDCPTLASAITGRSDDFSYLDDEDDD